MKRVDVRMGMGAAAALAALAVFGGEVGDARANRVRELLKQHPRSFELTVMSHFSDDDFGFHVQTADLPMDDSLFPRHMISAAQADAVVLELARSPFMDRAVEGARGERFRPAKAEPGRRVYGITLRCGDRAFFEEVASEDGMKARAEGIRRGLGGGDAAEAFDGAFRSRLGAAEPGPDTAAEQKRLEQIGQYLVEHVASEGMRWDAGPSPLRAAALTRAYPGCAFYGVESRYEPVVRIRPGERRVSLCLRIDGQGDIRVREGMFTGRDTRTLSFFDEGRIEIRDEETAALAAAAVMCLTRAYGGWQAVEPGDVRVERTGSGWTGTAVLGKGPPDDGTPVAEGAFPQHLYRVDFDDRGACAEVDYRYTGMLPVCFGGLFLPAEFVPGAASAARGRLGAAVLVSMERGSVAERSGLRAGDALCGFDGQPVPPDRPIEWLRERVVPVKARGGETHGVTVLRRGAVLDLDATWPPQRAEAD